MTLTVLQTRAGNQAGSRATLPLKILKEKLSFLFPASTGSSNLACGSVDLIFTWPSCLRVSLCVLSLVRTPLIRFRALSKSRMLSL